MKFTFDGRELSGDGVVKSNAGGDAGTPAPEGVARGEVNGGGDLRGATIRLIVVVAVSSLLFFFFARNMFSTFIVGTLTMALQAMMIEVIYEVLLRRGRTRIVRLPSRSDCRRRHEVVVWYVQVFVSAVVLAALVFFVCKN